VLRKIKKREKRVRTLYEEVDARLKSSPNDPPSELLDKFRLLFEAIRAWIPHVTVFSDLLKVYAEARKAVVENPEDIEAARRAQIEQMLQFDPNMPFGSVEWDMMPGGKALYEFSGSQPPNPGNLTRAHPRHGAPRPARPRSDIDGSSDAVEREARRATALEIAKAVLEDSQVQAEHGVVIDVLEQRRAMVTAEDVAEDDRSGMSRVRAGKTASDAAR
jgi:hypothetical protein